MRVFITCWMCVAFFIFCCIEPQWADGKDKQKISLSKLEVSKEIDASYGEILYHMLLDQLVSSGRVIIVDWEEINRMLRRVASTQSSISEEDAKRQVMKQLGIQKLYSGVIAKLGNKYYISVKVLNPDMTVEKVVKASAQSEDELEQGINAVSQQLISAFEEADAQHIQNTIPNDALPHQRVVSNLPFFFVPVTEAKYALLQGLGDGSREAQERQRQVVERTGYPLEVKTKKTGVHFRLVPGGTFMMGSPDSEFGRDEDEGMVHRVTISKPFYVSKFEITQGQWWTVMGTNPSRFLVVGKDAPVENVSWNDCQKFCFTLSQQEAAPSMTFRLPTEAQWEYACRAGTASAYVGAIQFLGWYDEKKPHPAGLKNANAWGLYDMYGNVYEWCQDWYRDAYPKRDTVDPVGPQSGEYRVIRGGSWFNDITYFRSANRGRYSPDHGRELIGFRLVVELYPN